MASAERFLTDSTGGMEPQSVTRRKLDLRQGRRRARLRKVPHKLVSHAVAGCDGAGILLAGRVDRGLLAQRHAGSAPHETAFSSRRSADEPLQLSRQVRPARFAGVRRLRQPDADRGRPAAAHHRTLRRGAAGHRAGAPGVPAGRADPAASGAVGDAARRQPGGDGQTRRARVRRRGGAGRAERRASPPHGSSCRAGRRFARAGARSVAKGSAGRRRATCVHTPS